MSATPFDIGVNSFGEVATDNGRVLDDAETVRLLVEPSASRGGGQCRSDLNDARSSSASRRGCSQAAKWPPLSTSFQWTRLP